ncbi:MAG: siphovirus Gp157 family protein [bacterium]
MTTLYDITAGIRDIMECVDENGELTQAQSDDLTALEMAFDEKVEAIVKFVRNVEADADAFKVESDRLAALRKSAMNKVAWLEDYLKAQMDARHLPKAGTKMGGARIQQGPPRVDVLDATLVPAEFMVPQPATLDKGKALMALKAGESVPGCTLTRGEFLRLT